MYRIVFVKSMAFRCFSIWLHHLSYRVFQVNDFSLFKFMVTQFMVLCMSGQFLSTVSIYGYTIHRIVYVRSMFFYCFSLCLHHLSSGVCQINVFSLFQSMVTPFIVSCMSDQCFFTVSVYVYTIYRLVYVRSMCFHCFSLWLHHLSSDVCQINVFLLFQSMVTPFIVWCMSDQCVFTVSVYGYTIYRLMYVRSMFFTVSVYGYTIYRLVYVRSMCFHCFSLWLHHLSSGVCQINVFSLFQSMVTPLIDWCMSGKCLFIVSAHAYIYSSLM